MEQVEKKKFKLFDAVLAAVCIVLVVEAAAPAASVGSSQYFWWIFLLIAFFLPYGLVNAELGTTYTGEGGLFDWVKRAFGRKWGSRVAWYYWVNFALWMASLAVLATQVVEQAFNISIPLYISLPAQLVFIWLVVFLSNYSIADNAILINIATVFKMIIILSLGIFGIYFGITQGFANPVHSFTDLLPGLTGISFIAVIIFNFLGFEVVTTFAGEMDNPKKQIPKALLLGGILVAVFYIFAAFGIGAAIPYADLSTDTGLLDAFNMYFKTFPIGGILLIVVGIMFIYTLIMNLLSWALGVNYVAMYAADNHALPKFFSMRKKNTESTPLGANLMNGIVASALVCIAPIMAWLTKNDNVFWSFFALQIITLLASYLLLFPAFRKLRNIDPDIERPFKVHGGKVLLNLITWVPVVLLVLAIIFCIAYPSGDNFFGDWTIDWALLIGSIVAFILGEVIAYVTGRKLENSKT